MQTDILAFFCVDMNGYRSNHPKRLSIGRFEVLEIGRKNVFALARRHALGELTHVVREDLPANFVGFVFCAADVYGNAVNRTIIRSPDSSSDQGIGLRCRLLSREQSVDWAEGEREKKSGEDRKQ